MLNPMKSNVIPIKIKVSLKIYWIPTPFNIIDFTIIINHFAGMILLITCIGNGMELIGKIKPDKMITGNIKPINEIIMAVCCEFEMVEINIPNESAVMMNRILSNPNKKRLPFIGIPKTKKPNNKI